MQSGVVLTPAQPAQGSAGIELNQCGVDIGFCTFARGRGSKGAAIYMQARGSCSMLTKWLG